MAHVFDPERLSRLEDEARFEELPPVAVSRHLSSGRTMDLGCGPGLYTRRIAEELGGEVYGIDLQMEMLRRFRAVGVPGNVSLLLALGSDLPFVDGSLTSIYSIHTLHEFAGDETLKEVRRVIRPGGVLVLVDWRREEMNRGPPMEHRIAVEKAKELISSEGFYLVEEDLIGKFYLIVARAE